MRIGYVVPEFPSQTHTFFWREITALRSLGHDVFPISTRRPDREACRHEFAAQAHAETSYLFPPGHALRTRPRATWLNKGFSYFRALGARSPRQIVTHAALAISSLELLEVARGFELNHVHVHSAANAAHVAAACHAMGGPPYSLTLHGDLQVYGDDHVAKMHGASFVATVTRPLRQQVEESVGLPRERVPVIWMGVDTGRFQPRTTAREPGALRLVTVARLNRQKGHLHALRALRTCRDSGLDVRYLVAGEGEFRPEIEAQIRSLGLQDSVEMLGTTSEQGVLELLLRADGFVLPSVGLGEAAPVSVMEAMAVGCPVICSRIGGTTDMISDGVDGYLVDQGDESALAQCFSRLATQPEEVRAVSQHARERALTAFDYRAMAARLATAIAGNPAEASLTFT